MTNNIDEKSLKRIVKEVVHETLTGLGFAPHEPNEMQANLIYLNKLRKGSEFMSIRAKASLIAFLIPTLLYFMWESLKRSFQQ